MVSAGARVLRIGRTPRDDKVAAKVVVSNLSSDSTAAIRNAIERNLEWIKSHILGPNIAEQDIPSYLDWICEWLKERVPQYADPQGLDRIVRKELRNLFGREFTNGRRKAIFGDVGELEDPSALLFERKIELSDEVRACLECIQKGARDLIIEAFTLTEADMSGKNVRNRLAARLGISRNTLDQRISRALRRIRARMRYRPGWNNPQE